VEVTPVAHFHLLERELAALRVELAKAQRKALEDAAQECDQYGSSYFASKIRALIDQPEVASRSRLKRIAAQKGEPMPDFSEELAEVQAKIDSLMMEFCPDEMTPEQIENWGRNQRAATPEESAAIDQPDQPKENTNDPSTDR